MVYENENNRNCVSLIHSIDGWFSYYLKSDIKNYNWLSWLIVALTTNMVTLYKLQENWIEYRAIAELLKHEKFLYITKAGPYRNNDSFAVFVEQIEGYLSKENTHWSSYSKTKEIEI